MSEHRASVNWQRTTDDFEYDTYNREHTWTIAEQTIKAAAAPTFKGAPDHVDPEEAFVAALSSCHMLTFLAIAARKKLVVDSYTDDAVGFMEKNDNGRLAITRVELRPKVVFAPDTQPSADVIARLHHSSHEHCFIANSVTTDVRVVD